MPDVLQSVLDRLTAVFGRRGLVAAVGILAVVVLLLVARWGGGPAWAPVLGNVPLEQMGPLTHALDEAKITYRLTAGGSRVEVAEQDLARARVELASRGLPGDAGHGFELFDQPAWGMTDFTQQINYRRALEGELERTIGEMDGVEGARVHLALHQGSVLRRSDRPTEASVVVRMRSVARPTAALVEGITFLVAGSVDELTSEHVTVLDQGGRLLSRSVENDPEFALSSRQLELRSRMEAYLEEKAEALVTDVVGSGNVRVQVTADLNLDRVDRTIQAVNPDQSLVTREERTEITPGPTDVGAGSVAYKTDYDATRSVERHTSTGGEIKRLSVAVLVNGTSTAGDGAASSPGEPELARLESLVAAAVGLDRSRGDVITVVGIPFDDDPPMLPPARTGPGVWDLVQMLQRPLLTVLALAAVLFLGLRAIRAVAPQGRMQQQLAGAPPASSLPSGASPELAAKQGGATVAEKGAQLRKQLSPAQAQRMQEVTSGVMERPDMAARVVEAWLKG